MVKGTKLSQAHRQAISEGRRKAYADGRIRGSNSKVRVVPDVSHVAEDFGHWLSGFVDGEGCFTVRRQHSGGVQVGFRLGLRADDVEILEEIRVTLGFGATYDHKSPTTYVSTFSVSAAAHCMALVALFRRFPLRAKKRQDFAIWSKIVERAFREDGLRFDDVTDLVDELRTTRNPEWLNE